MKRFIKLMVVLVSLVIGATTPFLSVPAVAGDQVNKITGSMDIASIVNFSEPSTSAALKAETRISIGGNPSVVISSRSQAPSNEWERYRMESYPQGRKDGILAGGVIAALRIEI
jgi:hypothetical protein